MSSASTGSAGRMSPFRAPNTLAACGTTTATEMDRSLSPIKSLFCVITQKLFTCVCTVYEWTALMNI